MNCQFSRCINVLKSSVAYICLLTTESFSPVMKQFRCKHYRKQPEAHERRQCRPKNIEFERHEICENLFIHFWHPFLFCSDEHVDFAYGKRKPDASINIS